MTNVEPLLFKIGRDRRAERLGDHWPERAEFSLGFIRRSAENQAELGNDAALVWRPPLLTIKCVNGQATYRIPSQQPVETWDTDRVIGKLVECSPESL